MKRLFHITESGVKRLQEELNELILRRAPIAERIRSAREFGDLSENAEYTYARLEHERVEGRILEIKNILQNAKLITRPKHASVVQLGSTVTLVGSDDHRQFQVVGTLEADPLEGRISDESPIGQNLLGKKRGDEVQIKSVSGVIRYTIVEIV